MFKTCVITDEVAIEKVQKVLSGVSEVEYKRSITEDEIIKNCIDADGIISLYEPITSKVMDALPNLKFISLASIGFDTVDVKYAKEKGIHVSNNPNYCVEEVADHAASLILTLSREIIEYNKSVKEDKVWQYDAAGENIYRLATRTLGLVGFGSISRKLAHRIQAFGTTVIAFDPFLSKEAGAEYNVEMVSIEELLERSNIISIHMPLNDKTKSFFNEDKFNQMKAKPIFINCARGEIVDEDALLKAIDSGIVSAAGLDVLYSENPDLENCELVNRDNVILTPHAAFYSQESMEEAQTFAAMHVEDFINNNLKDIPLIV